jgi:PhnB protein
MVALNPYLNFDGSCESAFNFYKSVFGGEFEFIQYLRETPYGKELPETEKNRIMHVSLPLGGGTRLMGSDILPSMGHKLVMGNNAHMSIHPKNRADADKLFNGLSVGGTVTVPLAEAFWGSYFGMFTDKFGVQWMVNVDETKA